MLAVKFKQTYALDFAPMKDYITSNFTMKPEEVAPVHLAVDNASKLRISVRYCYYWCTCCLHFLIRQ